MSPRLLSKAALVRHASRLERSLVSAKARMAALEEALTSRRGWAGEGPAPFVQLVAGGGFNVLYALDHAGLVWRYQHAYDKSTRTVSDERWVPVSMERRDK